jgi:hypothetical protein
MCKETRFGLGLCLAVVLAGCFPPPPPALDVWLESSLPLADDGSLQVPLGTQVTFNAHGSGGVGPYLHRWMVSGQIQTRFALSELNWTFNEPGNYVVEISLTDPMTQVSDSITVVVAGKPGEQSSPGKPVFIDGVIFWSGGDLNSDGSVNLGPGGRLDFDLTKILRGGTPPYRYYLDSGDGAIEQSGPIFSWWAPTVSVTTTFRLVIRVVDANGNSVEKWLVVIVVVNPPPPPPPPPSVTVDLKVNGSDGPMTVKARVSDNQQNIDLSWSITGSTQGTASGDWSGTKSTSGSMTVTLTVGTHIFGLGASNSQSYGSDNVVVVVEPADVPVTPVAVDLKANGSDGPIVNVKARTTDQRQDVTLSWSVTGATEGTASGAWGGTKATYGTMTTALTAGTYVFGLSAFNSQGQSGSDSITVVVMPADSPPPECDSTHSCGIGKHCENGVCVDDPVAPPEVEVLAPAMDSVVHKGVSVTFTVKITGGKSPYAVNWFFFDGTAPSTSSTSTTVSIPVVFNRTTAGQFPVDQYVQVVDSEGRVSAMVVVRIRVID